MMDLVQRLKNCLDDPDRIGWYWLLRDAAKEIERLRAELAACKADAERYRWLRTLHLGYTAAPNWDAVLLIPTASAEHTTLDQLVDAALAAKGE